MTLGFGTARGKGDILHGSLDNYHVGILKVGATATNVRTGRTVARSAAGKVQVGGDESETIIGVCRARVRKDTDKDMNPTFDRDADFATDDWIQVVKPKPGEDIELLLVDGEVVVFGDKLVPAAAGKVKKYAPDVTATVNETTVEAALKEVGSVLGRAKQDLSPSGADGWILLTWGQQ